MPLSNLSPRVLVCCALEDEIGIVEPLQDALERNDIATVTPSSGSGIDGNDVLSPANFEHLKNITSVVFILSPALLHDKHFVTHLKYYHQLCCLPQPPETFPLIFLVFLKFSVEQLARYPNERQDGAVFSDGIRIMKQYLAKETPKNFVVIQNTDVLSLNSSVPKVSEYESLVKTIEGEITSRLNYISLSQRQPQINKSDMTDETILAESFQPAFIVQKQTPFAVVDFSVCDGKPSTAEGALKLLLISGAKGRSEHDYPLYADIISLVGRSGVGKSTALHAISWEKGVRQYFSDGIYYFGLGEDANAADIMKELSRIVASAGGILLSQHILQAITLREGVDLAAKWFSGKKALFILDDLCRTEQSCMGFLSQLRRLICPPGRIVLSTCSEDIASTTGRVVKLVPLDARGERSLLMLSKHVEPTTTKPISVKPSTHLEAILDHCAGLPFLLAIAGRSLNYYLSKQAFTFAKAVETYLDKISTELTKCSSDPSNLDLKVKLSTLVALELASIEIRKECVEHQSGICSNPIELFMRFSALRKHVRVPLTTLQALWSLNRFSTEKIVNIFHSFHLLVYSRETIRVSNSCLITCRFLADHSVDPKKAHIELLRNYYSLAAPDVKACSTDSRISIATSSSEESACASPKGKPLSRFLSTYKRRSNSQSEWSNHKRSQSYSQPLAFSIENIVRTWWNKHLHSDNYLDYNLFWHLLASGNGEELESLVTDVRWLAYRAASRNFQLFRSDFWFVFKQLSKSHSVGVLHNRQDEFRIVQAAISHAWQSICQNPEEFEFQIFRRLGRISNKAGIVNRLINSIRSNGNKSWLMPIDAWLSVPYHPAKFEMILKKSVSAVAVSGDIHSSRTASTRYAFFGTGHSVLQMDLNARVFVAELNGNGKVTCLSVSEDGSLIVAGSEDGSICTWDSGTGKIVREIHMAPRASITCVATNRNGHRIASGSDDNKVRVWKTRTAGISLSLHGHTDNVTCVAMSADGKKVVTGSRDRTIRAWNIKNDVGAETVLGSHEGEVLSISISADGRWMLSCGADNIVKIWDVRKKIPYRLFPTSKTVIRHVGINFDSTSAVLVSSNLAVEKWNLQNMQQTGCQMQNIGEHLASNTSLTVSCDGKLAVFASQDGEVRVLGIEENAKTEKGFDEFTTKAKVCSVSSISTSRNGQWGISLASDGKASVWNLDQQETKPKLLGSLKGSSCVSISNDGHRAVSGSRDGALRVWNVDRSIQEGHDMKKHSSRITCLSLSADKNLVVSGYANSSIVLWNIKSQKPIGTPWNGHTGAINCIEFSTDDQWIVSGSADRTIRLWRQRGQGEVCTIASHAMAVESIGISHGNVVTTVSKDKIVRSRIDSRHGLVIMYEKESRHGILSPSWHGTSQPWTPTEDPVPSVFHILDGLEQDVRLHFCNEKIYLSTQKERTLATLPKNITCMSVHAGQRRLLTGHADGSVHHFLFVTPSQ